jgi:hypothetical protein
MRAARHCCCTGSLCTGGDWLVMRLCGSCCVQELVVDGYFHVIGGPATRWRGWVGA